MFTPPANIDDFSKSSTKEDTLKKAWHDKMNRIVSSLTSEKDDEGNLYYPRFYNPLEVSENKEVINKVISWSGYPLIIENWLNLSSASSKQDHDQGFRSAEILREIVRIFRVIKENGVVVGQDNELVDFNLANGIALFPVENESIQSQEAFSLKERIQDEYLEWHTRKDNTGKIVEITYTAEGPEYWETIAEHDPDLLTRLYQDYVSPEVKTEDLYWQKDIACPVIETELSTGVSQLTSYTYAFRKGTYNPYNKWNTQLGIMHLIQRNNTLGAEVRLAADSTKRYSIKPDLSYNPTRFELVACGVPAGINRNSDPTISEEVNKLALSDLEVSISNPIGLYIGDIQVSGIRDAQGNPVDKDDILIIERGDLDPFSPKILRFKLVIPNNSEKGLETYSLNGFKLKYGGPVAKETSIVIYGEARESQVANPILPCSGKACYNPQKPSYVVPVGIGESCSSINWARIRPPFNVAAPIQNLSNNLTVIEIEKPFAAASRNIQKGIE